MKTLLTIVLLLCAACSQAAEPDYFSLNNGLISSPTGPGISVRYESFVSSPGEVYDNGELIAVYPDWFYDYYIENLSTDHSISQWYWFHGPYGGAIDGSLLPVGGLAPASAEGLDPTDSYFESFFDSPSSLIQVQSRIVFDDNTFQDHPVYIPSTNVPEPNSLFGLAFGLGGLMPLFSYSFRRRKMNYLLKTTLFAALLWTAATAGGYAQASAPVEVTNSPTVKIDPAANAVKVDPTANTVKVDPNANKVKAAQDGTWNVNVAGSVRVAGTSNVNVVSVSTVKSPTLANSVPLLVAGQQYPGVYFSLGPFTCSGYREIRFVNMPDSGLCGVSVSFESPDGQFIPLYQVSGDRMINVLVCGPRFMVTFSPGSRSDGSPLTGAFWAYMVN